MARNLTNSLQYPMTFYGSFGPADIGSTVELDVPPGFVLLGASIRVRTAFDGTTPKVGVTDNKGSPTTIIAATTDLTATAVTNSSTANLTEYPNGGTIIVSPVNSGGTTAAGAADVVVQGFVKGRQNELFNG